MLTGQLENAEAALSYALAGNARLTLVSKKTGTRYTYRVRASKDGGVHFVSLLTGADNENSYQFIGTVRPGSAYRHGAKTKISEAAPGPRAFKWFWEHANRGDDLNWLGLEVWHEGRCGRCGRALTVPSSVARGIGPECAEKMGFLCEAA